MICADREFIKQARRNRTVLGGNNMRQVGILAAACLVALDQMVERLQEDHVNARFFAYGLAAIPNIKVEPANTHTNMVFFDLVLPGVSRTEIVERLRSVGILVNIIGAIEIRAVTHYGIVKSDMDEALKRIGFGVSTTGDGHSSSCSLAFYFMYTTGWKCLSFEVFKTDDRSLIENLN